MELNPHNLELNVYSSADEGHAVANPYLPTGDGALLWDIGSSGVGGSFVERGQDSSVPGTLAICSS